MFGNDAGLSRNFISDVNVQKLTVNSALQLYAIRSFFLLLLPDLRYGFLNSEALNIGQRMSCCTKCTVKCGNTP